MFLKKWPLEYQKVIKTYFRTDLWDSSDSSDSFDSSDSSKSSDSSDSSDSSTFLPIYRTVVTVVSSDKNYTISQQKKIMQPLKKSRKSCTTYLPTYLCDSSYSSDSSKSSDSSE